MFWDPNCHRNYPPVASNMPSWEITEKNIGGLNEKVLELSGAFSSKL
jgi:hypothetical protein